MFVIPAQAVASLGQAPDANAEGWVERNELKTYRGSCHCGAVEFSFRAREIGSGKRCNCSLRRRRGALMSVDYYPIDAFLALPGLESLAVYHFGDNMVNHYLNL